MAKRGLGPFAAVILAALYAADIFFLGNTLAGYFGAWGLFLQEFLLLCIGVGAAVVCGADLRRVFPFKRPELLKTIGVFIFWLGSFWAAGCVIVLLMWLFPSLFAETAGVESIIDSFPFLPVFLLVAVTPAICEEAAMRGALFSCFRGFKNRWAALVLTAVIFGAFHGSIGRLIPLSMLGLAMGYILAETENMFYNMLFHLVNNTVPILLLEFSKLWFSFDGSAPVQTPDSLGFLSLMSVGVGLCYVSPAPFLIYIGDYFLHKKRGGEGIFSGRRKEHMLPLLCLFFGFLLLGLFFIGVSILQAGVCRKF